MEGFAIAGGEGNRIVLDPSLPQPNSSTLVSGSNHITVTQIIAGSKKFLSAFSCVICRAIVNCYRNSQAAQLPPASAKTATGI